MVWVNSSGVYGEIMLDGHILLDLLSQSSRQVLFTADLRAFRDYNDNSDAIAKSEVEEALTPKKRKLDDLGTAMAFPLIPPPTIKSETISIDVKVEINEINEKLRSRSKRPKIGANNIKHSFRET